LDPSCSKAAIDQLNKEIRGIVIIQGPQLKAGLNPLLARRNAAV
jgi:hypothetical protein